MVTLGIVLFYVIPALVMVEIVRYAYLEHRRDRIPILLYHRLVARADVESGRVPDREPIFAVYDDRFRSQMQVLHEQGFSTLSLDELKAIRSGKIPRPAKPVAITFDDGYGSNYRLAWPVLRKYGLRATIFVALEPDEETRARVHGIDSFLSEEQMREMDSGGVSIESHTLTHRILTELDDEAVRHELCESKRRLGEILSRPVRHLAIPRAGYDRRIRRLAAGAGYETICGNQKGTSSGWSSIFALPRIVIERHMGTEEFASALRPLMGVLLRLSGNFKRLPARLLGPSAAGKLRHLLYATRAGRFLEGNWLRGLLAGCALVYLAGSLLFSWYLLSR